MTQKQYVTLRHLEVHPHTEFVVPTANNVGDMLQTRLLEKRDQGHSDPKMVPAPALCHPKMHGQHTK